MVRIYKKNGQLNPMTAVCGQINARDREDPGAHCRLADKYIPIRPSSQVWFTLTLLFIPSAIWRSRDCPIGRTLLILSDWL